MLTRRETIKVSLIGAAVIALAVGGELLTAGQVKRIKEAEGQLSVAVAPNKMAEAAAKKKKIKKLKIDLAKWKVLLAGAEKLFPKGPKEAITNVDVAALMASTNGTLVKCDKGTTTELSWNPPKAAEGEGGSTEEPAAEEGEAAAAVGVKYVEDVLQLRLSGDYQSWLDFLVALEQLQKFYRFKDLTMKSVPGSKGKAPLTIDVQLASYHVLEFPSERKPEKKNDE